MVEAAHPSRTTRIILGLDRAAERRWFLPAVSAFPLADYLIPFLPNQMLLIALSVLRPARWLALAATFVTAGALGAALTAWAVQQCGAALLDRVLGGRPEQAAADNVIALVRVHGAAALILLAALPWPPRVAVIVCALAGLPPLAIGGAVALGRVLPVGAYALIGAKAPHLLRRLPAVDRVLRDVQARRSPQA